MKTKLLLLLFLSYFSLLNAKVQYVSTVSNLQGNLSVNTGTLNYTVPLSLPTGTAGVKPNVSLSYSSNGGNEYVGVGWNINAGQSVIRRCASNLALDGKVQGVKYDSSDNICLDGQRLVVVSGSKWNSSSEYRTKIDTYSKIIYDGTNFKVYTKAGDIKEYTKYNQVWLLDSIKDRYNNAIHYNYHSSSSETYLSSITYSDNKIQLNYENKIDKFSGYSNGKKIEVTKRLKSIDVKSANKTLRTYKLTYNSQSSSLDKSTLKSLQECSDWECLEPMKFYAPVYYNYGTYKHIQNIQGDGSGIWNKSGPITGDVNGDGLTDIIFPYYDSSKGLIIRTKLSNGDGTYKHIQNIQGDGSGIWNKSGPITGDVNGDGLTDIIFPYYDSSKGLIIRTKLSNGDGTYKHIQNIQGDGSGIWNKSGPITGDVNGDGLTDIIFPYYDSSKGLIIRTKLSNGDGTYKHIQNIQGDGSGIWNKSGPITGDVNGDGLTDIIFPYYDSSKGLIIRTKLSNGDGTYKHIQNIQGDGSGIWNKSGPITGDVNGDGLTDIIFPYYNSSKGLIIRTKLSNGDGTYKHIQNIQGDGSGIWNKSGPITGDVNGDGLTDIIFPYYDSSKGLIIRTKLSNGDGTYKHIQNIQGDGSGIWNKSGPRIGDVNGDGLTDMIFPYYNSSKGLIIRTKLSQYKISKLISITDSFKNTTTINYKRLNEKSNPIYKKYTNSKYPDRDIISPMSVVESIVTRGSNNAVLKTRYKYEGLKANIKGLGSFGFAKITTINTLNNAKNITTFNQSYPYVGTVSKALSYLDDELISEADYLYSNVLKDGIYQIRNTKQISKNYEDGALLKTTIIRNSNYDNYGNTRTSISTITDETTGESFIKTANNVYINDTSNWILSRLTSAKVKSEAYGDTQTRNSSFTYDETTGILKTETIEPESDKWLKKSYTYDSHGNKIKESVSGADIQTRTTTTSYDSKGKFATKITNALGHTQTNEYNEDGQILKITSPNGLVTSFEYDSFGKKTKESRADGTTTTYDYNFDSSIPQSYYSITVTRDGTSAVTTYFSKLNQNIRTQTIGFDGRVIYTDKYYDKFGNVVKTSSPYSNGETKEYSYIKYDKYKRTIEVDSPAPNNKRAISTNVYNGYTLINTNAKGQVKSTTKNVLGKVVKIQEEEGAYELYSYDALGNLLKTTDAMGNEIVVEYDIRGNKTHQKDPDMGEWNYRYNALGQLISQTDAKGQTTSIKYDLLGRKVSENLNGSLSTWQYDTTKKGKLHKESKTNFTRTYSYDNLLRLASITTTTDAKTFTKSFTYDKFSRVESKTLPKNFIIKNVYNDYGYLEAIKSPKKQIKDFDPELFVTLIEKTLDDAIDSYKKSLEYADKAKKLKAKVAYYTQIAARYSNNKQKYLDYAKRLDSYAARYEYYGQKYKHQAAYYKRIADNYMSKADRYRGYRGRRGNSINSYYTRLANKYKWYSSRYAYYSNLYLNAAQRLRNYADMYERAAKALKESKEAVAIAKNYSQRSQDGYEVNRAYQVILDDSKYNYFYKVLQQDSYGRVTKYISGNGLITTKEYDNSGVLGKIKTGYNFDDAIRELHFEYDSVLNVTSREDKKLQVTQGYTYDNLNRVVSATSTTQNNYTDLSYDYDTIGNMTYKSDIGSYTYSGSSPHQVTNIGDKHFIYDLNGNMTNNNGTLIEYTAFNKTSKLKTPNATINFSYDTNHNRYKKSTDKYTSYYIDKSYEQTINKDNTVEDKYFIYVGSKVMSIYTDNSSSPSTKYLHYDSLNSVDTITNNLGVVESRAAYKPFGEKLDLDKYGRATQKAPHTNRGYTGHEHIEETKFINMNARLYDPTIARFMSADSIIPFQYDTQAFNRYSYVKNNPLKYTDPSGHSWFSETWKKLKKWTKKNWRKIAGAVLIVAGAVATYYGFVIGISMMTTGASLIKYNPDEPASPTNEIRVDVGTNGTPPINFDFNGDFQNQYTQDNDQGKYIVNNVTQGTHSTTTGNKFSNGGDSATYNGTVGYDISYNPNTNGSIIVGTITVSNFNSGSDVLVVDGVKNERNIQKSFFDGVYSIGIALMRFGDYLAKISGFRDWQNGSVVMRNYYQNQAIRETKLTYRMAKYIVTNSIASSIFINSSYKYIMSNPKYFAGRVFAGPVLGFVARNPIWGTGSTVGDLSYTAESIDNLSRNLILGY